MSELLRLRSGQVSLRPPKSRARWRGELAATKVLRSIPPSIHYSESGLARERPQKRKPQGLKPLSDKERWRVGGGGYVGPKGPTHKPDACSQPNCRLRDPGDCGKIGVRAALPSVPRDRTRGRSWS